MEITSTVIKERKLDEYDITFVGGHMMTVSVCRDEGDEVNFDESPSIIHFQLVAKRSLTVDGTLELPPEDIIIYKEHILAIQHRTRTIQPISAEQKAEWDHAFKAITNRVQ